MNGLTGLLLDVQDKAFERGQARFKLKACILIANSRHITWARGRFLI